MALDNESFNKQLYDLLKVRGYQPVPKNSKNQDVEASQQADVIEFQFIKDGENYGKAWASIDDAQNVIIYYDDQQADSPEGRSPNLDYDDSWSGFLKHVKTWAQRKQLSFELLNKDRLGDDMKQRNYVKSKNTISEGYYPMGKQASYNDAIPTIKIVLQHTRQIQEGEQRYRNIARIFLENNQGERILAPTTRPGIAQVYARHLAEGGVPNDERWNHIKSLCEEYQKMAGFVRATRNGQFNESATELVTEGVKHYQSLRETLGKLRGHRGYNAYFESWTPTLMENEGEEANLNQLFVQERVDPRIESAMPILSRLRKNVVEVSEINQLESWADSVINEKLDLVSETQSPEGPKGDNTDNFFLESVTESLDQPYDLKWTEGAFTGEWDAEATTSDGSSILILFELNDDSPGNRTEVTVDFYRNEKQKVTGEGDSQRVFATVLNAIRQYIKKENPDSIRFVAVKPADSGKATPSRVSLYNRMVQRYSSDLGYRAKIDDAGGAVSRAPGRVVYTLTKNDPSPKKKIKKDKETVAESLDQPYPLEWHTGGYDGEVEAISRLSDGSILGITFYPSDSSNLFSVDVDFSRNDRQDVTGEGDAQRIFATVLEAIKAYVEHEGPDRLTFTAVKDGGNDQDSGSRIKLYNRLVQRYASQIGYQVSTKDYDNSIEYVLVKNHSLGKMKNMKKKQISELSKDTLKSYHNKAWDDRQAIGHKMPDLAKKSTLHRGKVYSKDEVETAKKAHDDLRKLSHKYGQRTKGIEAADKKWVDKKEAEQMDEDKAQYRYTGGMHGEYHPTKKQPSRAAHIDAAKFHERESKTYSKALGEKGADKDYVNRAIDYHSDAASHHRNMASSMKEEVEQINEAPKSTHENPLITIHDKADRLIGHMNLSTANKIYNTNVKHTDIHKGAVKTRDGWETKNHVKYALSRHHKKEATLDEGTKADIKAAAQLARLERHNAIQAAKKLGSYVKKASPDSSLKSMNQGSRYGKGEVEQIDEISKKTLGSYVKKATSSSQVASVGLDREGRNISVGDPMSPGSEKRLNKYQNQLTKRKAGIDMAVDKLVREHIEKLNKLTEGASGVELNEGPFTGLGKMMMKHQLKKDMDSHLAARDVALDQTLDQARQFKFDGGHEERYNKEYDEARRRARALNRLKKFDEAELNEGPFTGIGKHMMKRKLKKGMDSDIQNAGDAYFSGEYDGVDKFMDVMANRRRKEKALNRLEKVDEVYEDDQLDSPGKVYVLAHVDERTVGHGTTATEVTLASEDAYAGTPCPAFKSREAAEAFKKEKGLLTATVEVLNLI